MNATRIKQIAVSDVGFHQKIIDKYRADIGKIYKFPMLIFYNSPNNVLFQKNNLHILLGLHSNRYLQIIKSALRPWIVLKEPDKINHFKQLLLYNTTSRSGIHEEVNNKVLYSDSFVRSILSFNKVALFNSQILDKFSYKAVVNQQLHNVMKIIHYIRRSYINTKDNAGSYPSTINKNQFLFENELNILLSKKNLLSNNKVIFNSQILDKFLYKAVVNQQLHNVIKIIHYIRRSYINTKDNTGSYPSTINKNQFLFENELNILLSKKNLLSNNKVILNNNKRLFYTRYNKQPDDNVFFPRHPQIFLNAKNKDFVFHSSQDIEYEVNQIKNSIVEIQKTVAEKTLPVYSSINNDHEQYIDMNRVSDQVFQMIDRKIKIESERRGIF